MAYELKEGSGGIFKNTSKIAGDNLPDYQGNAMVHGKEVRIALWLKDGQKGKFFSVAIKDAQPKAQPKAQDPFDRPIIGDDIPF